MGSLRPGGASDCKGQGKSIDKRFLACTQEMQDIHITFTITGSHVPLNLNIMKKIILMPVLAILLVSYGQKPDYLDPQEIIIAGQIINYDPGLEKDILTVYINDNGRADQLQYPSKIDSLGYFKVGFKRYYPQDVMISNSYNKESWVKINYQFSLKSLMVYQFYFIFN